MVVSLFGDKWGQYSDALRDKNRVLKPFIKDFPSFSRAMFKD